MAHNARGYDSHFVLAYCVENTVTPTVIYNGSKIMYMSVGHGLNVKFIDSLNFLPMPLKDLPKALGLNQDLRKGDFPHFFNVEGNFEYVGPMPEPRYYGVDFMKSSARDSFMAWYDKNADSTFDFQKEIMEYTRTDVAILREACMKFRDLIKEATLVRRENEPERYVDVFAHATLASAAMHIIRYAVLSETHKVTLKSRPDEEIMAELRAGVWTDTRTGRVIDGSDIIKKRFMKSQIPQIPARGYTKSAKHSVKSIAWLEWVSVSELGAPRKIQHARNGGEYSIPGTRYLADGHYGNTLYEFYGCYYHGHQCVPNRSVRNTRTRKTMAVLYSECMRREAEIKALGYEVVTIWECQWDLMVSENDDLKAFVAGLDMPPPLRIREALMGGRTCPIRLYHECVAPDEVIKYMDVTSMYSTANLHMKVPTCHPEIITDPNVMDFSLEPYFGLIKAKVLPPTDLYIPVLPYRANAKLLFPLCRTCAEKGDPGAPECTCSDDKRALTGTWCTDEVKKAMTVGYRILAIYEIYHYPETTQYDPATGRGGLFKEYVQAFLKLKQEASGYPAGCDTDDAKEAYVRSYALRQGIQLDKAKIEYNPGLRLVAKLFLNSCWGKFCERGNRPKVIFVKTRLELARLQNDVSKEIINFHIVNEDVIAVEITADEEFCEESTYTNEVIGALTTCFGRLYLLEIIQKLGRDVLYFDTDSVIFLLRQSEWSTPYGPLEIGDLLGELTDELEDPEDYIKVFGSSGPKCYTYMTSKGKTTLKIKGVTLNHANKQKFTFESVKKVIHDEITEIVTPMTNQICRQKYTGLIYNRPFRKAYIKTFNKRRILNDGTFDTVPYGYRERDTEMVL
jgi:hypothetical protein